MNEQYEKSLTKLELDKVLAMLSDHAASQAANELLTIRGVKASDKGVFRGRGEKRAGAERAGCVLPADHHE